MGRNRGPTAVRGRAPGRSRGSALVVALRDAVTLGVDDAVGVGLVLARTGRILGDDGSGVLVTTAHGGFLGARGRGLRLARRVLGDLLGTAGRRLARRHLGATSALGLGHL